MTKSQNEDRKTDHDCGDKLQSNQPSLQKSFIEQELEDLYHKIGKVEVWNANNDEVCDLCEDYVKKVIQKAREELKKIWDKKYKLDWSDIEKVMGK